MSVPEWLVPGAEAVILQPWSRGALRAESVAVERVLKRDVVLSNGERFRAADLTKHMGTWGVTQYLVPPSDPRVAETRAAIRLSRARSEAIYLADEYRRSKVTARDVADAWSRLADVEEANR